ncbi:DUF4268 domain-containing protein [Erythrobacter sp.]|uniref:DUF4268 domain-containing protein n=1 Tax=Erythrobacter sp. TaxID=1042 RepID=UPI001425E986|nr:DUF4268 domain-containing protein [Erythrobacter sp.]QIQ86029.1 MAG: DUF4268 domain-containing protein [Erythrobacter sp.]
MFRVDQKANALQALKPISFAAAGLRERDHLQEWIAKAPEALGQVLGEDILIIQKEFDGFDGTRERLDLLAIDKSGQLMVIENKLDDSGRDVVWQAMKYAAYCSSLTRADIIAIFARYLGDGEARAEEELCNFLECESLEQVVLNEGHAQRILFIAANFRREVTSTALWLREHQIDVRCIRVSPFEFEGQLLLDMQQIIPPPEATDYMIKMSQKDSEEKSAKGAQKWSHEMRHAFWTELLATFQQSGVTRWQNISPSHDHWISASTGVGGCTFALVFLRQEVRAELNFERPSKDENKWVYARLAEDRARLDQVGSIELEWLRKPDKIKTTIQCRKSFQGYSKDNWPEMIEWLKAAFLQLEETFAERVTELGAELRAKT